MNAQQQAWIKLLWSNAHMVDATLCWTQTANYFRGAAFGLDIGQVYELRDDFELLTDVAHYRAVMAHEEDR